MTAAYSHGNANVVMADGTKVPSGFVRDNKDGAVIGDCYAASFAALPVPCSSPFGALMCVLPCLHVCLDCCRYWLEL